MNDRNRDLDLDKYLSDLSDKAALEFLNKAENEPVLSELENKKIQKEFSVYLENVEKFSNRGSGSNLLKIAASFVVIALGFSLYFGNTKSPSNSKADSQIEVDSGQSFTNQESVKSPSPRLPKKGSTEKQKIEIFGNQDEDNQKPELSSVSNSGQDFNKSKSEILSKLKIPSKVSNLSAFDETTKNCLVSLGLSSETYLVDTGIYSGQKARAIVYSLNESKAITVVDDECNILSEK